MTNVATRLPRPFYQLCIIGGLCLFSAAAAAQPASPAAPMPAESAPASPPAGAATPQQMPTDSVPVPPPPPAAVYLPPPPPAPAPVPAALPAGTVAVAKSTVGAKFSTELYGFVEFDSILDSRQGFNEVAGNAVMPKRNVFAGEHERLTFSGRNSRLGFKIKGGETENVHPSAIIEMDFLGNQPTPISEAALLTNPTFRIRHMAVKVETPFIDVLAGQYWQLFGWQSYFFPNSVEIMGLPGQVFGRAPQLRLSHAFKTDAVTVELAVAGSRPPQRDAALPDGQAGVRMLFNKWKGMRTANSTGSAIDSAGIGVSGVYRQLRVNEFAANPVSTRKANAGGVSVDVLLPIIPATAEDKSFALTLTGSYVRGTGISDLFTGLTGGVAYPALDNPMMASPAPTYAPNIDPGLVTYTAGGDLHSIDWQSIMGGLQWYLTQSGRVWVSANASQMNSKNIDLYAATPASASKAFNRSRFADGNLFVDVTKALRVGAEVAWFNQRFVDGSTAQTYRYQLSAFYMF